MNDDVIMSSNRVLKMEKGNEIINNIIQCLKNQNLTYEEATYILERAKKELMYTTIIII